MLQPAFGARQSLRPEPSGLFRQSSIDFEK